MPRPASPSSSRSRKTLMSGRSWGVTRTTFLFMTGVAAWLSTSSCLSASSTSPMWSQPSATATSRTSVATAPSTPTLPRRLTVPRRSLQPQAHFLNTRGRSQRPPSTSTSPSILTTITRSATRETQTQVKTTNLLPMLTTTMETMASSITRGRSRRRMMSIKPGWAALQNPVVCRQPQLTSQRHGRTCFGLLVTSSAGLTTPFSNTLCGFPSYAVIGMEIPLGACSGLHFQPQGSVLSLYLPLPAFLCSMKPAVQTRRSLVTAG